jgi:hypothetical protein
MSPGPLRHDPDEPACAAAWGLAGQSGGDYAGVALDDL